MAKTVQIRDADDHFHGVARSGEGAGDVARPVLLREMDQPAAPPTMGE
jgi:hypothetical protein